MKKIFITGGSGTVGTSFIKQYYDNTDVTMYDQCCLITLRQRQLLAVVHTVVDKILNER